MSHVTEKPSDAFGSGVATSRFSNDTKGINHFSLFLWTSHLKQLQRVCFGFVLIQPNSRNENSAALGLILLLPGSFRKENTDCNNCRYSGGSGSFQWKVSLKPCPDGTSQPLTEYLSCFFFTQHTSWST